MIYCMLRGCNRSLAVLLLGTVVGLLSGCQEKVTIGTANTDGYYGYGPAEFLDDAQTNTTVDAQALDLSFLDTAGNTHELKSYRDKKNVVLVVTRGFAGVICPFCTAQTSRLITNYQQFADRDAEVLVVYPGDSATIQEFLQGAKAEGGTEDEKVPFPVLLDEGFQAIDRLGIRADLAAPSTYIIDKSGQLRFAYVGAHPADRPSITALLKQLDTIQGNTPE